jgi:cyclopropane fatty-acyl-phospholipid synthase-like methyltransferase
LDAGCGCGYGAVFLAENGAKRVTGIDVSPDAIAYAQKNFARANLEFEVMDGTTITFNSGFFDVVVSLEVIEHICKYENYISEVSRVLKPNGLLIISTPNKHISSPGSEKPRASFHVKEFYPDEFRELLVSHFQSVELLGKRVINQDFLSAENKTLATARFRFGMRLPFRLRRLTPSWLKELLLPKSPTLNLDDFEVSNTNVETASNIIAICRKGI